MKVLVIACYLSAKANCPEKTLAIELRSKNLQFSQNAGLLKLQ